MCYRAAVLLIEVLLWESIVANDTVGMNRHAQLADMWVCTGWEIGTTRDQRSSPDVPLAVSLGKGESCLNGGTEYEGFERTSRSINNKFVSECKSWCYLAERKVLSAFLQWEVIHFKYTLGV